MMGIQKESDILFEKVLLVEDDSGHAMLIQRAMKECVTTIEHVSRVADALSSASERSLDLIITDLNLPDSNGVDHVGELCSSADLVDLSSRSS